MIELQDKRDAVLKQRRRDYDKFGIVARDRTNRFINKLDEELVKINKW